eukprot:4027509-Prymnesium_polylepis.1
MRECDGAIPNPIFSVRSGTSDPPSASRATASAPARDPCARDRWVAARAPAAGRCANMAKRTSHAHARRDPPAARRPAPAGGRWMSRKGRARRQERARRAAWQERDLSATRDRDAPSPRRRPRDRAVRAPQSRRLHHKWGGSCYSMEMGHGVT